MNMDLDLIRAWKDEDYRESLSGEQLALLAGNPAGLIELTEEEMGQVDGAVTPIVGSLVASAIASAIGSAIVGATVALSIERCWVMF